MLGTFIKPDAWVFLVPLGLIFVSVVSFEIAMAVTISTLPRSRFRHRWTVQESRRVLRVFCVVFGIWPMIGAVLLGHLYTALWQAVIIDVVVLAIVVACIRWLVRGIRERRLVLAGHCADCFYDLRASKQREQCPECGAELSEHPVLNT